MPVVNFAAVAMLARGSRGRIALELARNPLAMTAVPTAPSAYVLATQMGGHGAAVAMLISSGTLIAAVTLPLWLAASAP